ncbi:hypothetical protein G8770_13715 [Aestuariicella hydrocarbonica]|uniref:Imelysin-like domain-containing protein n=1 Tax=Pseudomaricurvus hydrocarbonicus TaxID=1470433 RepID=A0A9E5K0U1_9GAMM|nr:imelysin family protein [Aestuariicella hydrocarbonica]NHO66602.1 hypothetical protein [Aestuariicella hydrocarbonica]
MARSRPRLTLRQLSGPLLTTCLLSVLLSGCDPSGTPENPTPTNPAGSLAEAPPGMAISTEHTWELARGLHRKAREESLKLQQAVDHLIEAPTGEHLKAAQTQWFSTHQQLQKVMPLLTFGRTAPESFRQLEQARWQLDAWPIEPGYLDYVAEYSFSGIVNDISLPLSAEALQQQHGLTSEADISLGLHAMAYLLWGEQQQRPISDYRAQPLTEEQRQNGLTDADRPAVRRATLLRLQASALVEEMESLGYKLSHPASAINTLYSALPPRQQVKLWGNSIVTLLNQELNPQLLADEQSPADAPLEATPLAAPTAEERTASEQAVAQQEAGPPFPHNTFSGAEAQSLIATLNGLEKLLLDHDAGAQPLAYWMQPDRDVESLKTALQNCRSVLMTLEPRWGEMTPEESLQLHERARALIDWFPAATSGSQSGG